MVWKINALREYNLVGVVVAVLTGLMTAIVFYGKTPNPDSRGQFIPFCLVFGAVAFFMVLMRSNTEIDLDRKVIRTGRGLGPIIAWKESSFSGSLSVVIGAKKGRYVDYTAELIYNGDRRVSLLAGGGVTSLESVVNLAERIGAQIQPGPGFMELAPERVRQRLGLG